MSINDLYPKLPIRELPSGVLGLSLIELIRVNADEFACRAAAAEAHFMAGSVSDDEDKVFDSRLPRRNHAFAQRACAAILADLLAVAEPFTDSSEAAPQ